MKPIVKISLLAASGLLASGAAFAQELGAPNQGAPTAVFQSWNSATRVLTLKTGLIPPHVMFSCTVAADLAVPATIAPGRAIYVRFTGPGGGQPGGDPIPGNTCTQISFQ